jgi:hypothetical protein
MLSVWTHAAERRETREKGKKRRREEEHRNVD